MAAVAPPPLPCSHVMVKGEQSFECKMLDGSMRGGVIQLTRCKKCGMVA